MRQEITVRVRRGEKIEYEQAILWVNELPPEYRRGKNRKMKSRKHKQLRQQPVGEKPARRSARRHDRGD